MCLKVWCQICFTSTGIKSAILTSNWRTFLSCNFRINIFISFRILARRLKLPGWKRGKTTLNWRRASLSLIKLTNIRNFIAILSLLSIRTTLAGRKSTHLNLTFTLAVFASLNWWVWDRLNFWSRLNRLKETTINCWKILITWLKKLKTKKAIILIEKRLNIKYLRRKYKKMFKICRISLSNF